MLRIAMSTGAANLLRALIARAGVPRDRILLTDVQSTDWQSLTLTGERHLFDLRDIVDLSDRGFPLLGGRLDYVDGHSAATLAYGRRLHTINLFVWRSGDGEPKDGSFAVRGYSLLHWTSGGLSYWAVSDAAPSELDAFHEAYTK